MSAPLAGGTLMAIGGGLSLEGEVLQEFYRRSGGAAGRVVILPTASLLADSGREVAQALAKLGLRSPARVLPLRSRADASRPEFIRAAREASGLFMTGGDQSRLAEALCETPFYQAMLEMHRRGGTVAGTSAGAAALSEMMITCGESGSLPYPNMARFSPGLGLIASCVFDQHFRQRNRIGRLLYAVACHPELVGIGVDEDTAAVVNGDMLSVSGSGAVTVVDGAGLTGTSLHAMRLSASGENKIAALSGVCLHILTRGGQYDLRNRQGCSLHC
jgi:cyanophycinase